MKLICITVTACEADLNLRSDTIMQYDDVWPTFICESSLNDSFGHNRLTALIWGLYICTDGNDGNVTVQLTVEYGSAILTEKSCIIPLFLLKNSFFSFIFYDPNESPGITLIHKKILQSGLQEKYDLVDRILWIFQCIISALSIHDNAEIMHWNILVYSFTPYNYRIYLIDVSCFR